MAVSFCTLSFKQPNVLTAHAQRRPSSPLRSEAPERAKTQGKSLSRSGRNARSTATAARFGGKSPLKNECFDSHGRAH